MSRKFQKKTKELINLEVVSSSEVWDLKNKKNGKPTIRKDIKLFGRVDKGTSAFIKGTNKVGNNYKYIDDTCNLPKNAKNKIVNMFDNENKKTAYLIEKQ